MGNFRAILRKPLINPSTLTPPSRNPINIVSTSYLSPSNHISIYASLFQEKPQTSRPNCKLNPTLAIQPPNQPQLPPPTQPTDPPDSNDRRHQQYARLDPNVVWLLLSHLPRDEEHPWRLRAGTCPHGGLVQIIFLDKNGWFVGSMLIFQGWYCWCFRNPAKITTWDGAKTL